MGAVLVVVGMSVLTVGVLAVGALLGKERREKIVMFSNKLGE